MYALNPSYLSMTTEQQDNFRKVLNSFYKSALYTDEGFEEFEDGLKKITLDKDDKQSVKNVSQYISKYINEKDDQFKKLFGQNKSLKTTSKILAALIVKDSDIMKDVKLGGKNNFINYVELSIAESLTENNSLKVVLQDQKQETMKSIREMQYHRHFAPDQLLR